MKRCALLLGILGCLAISAPGCNEDKSSSGGGATTQPDAPSATQPDTPTDGGGLAGLVGGPLAPTPPQATGNNTHADGQTTPPTGGLMGLAGPGVVAAPPQPNNPSQPSNPSEPTAAQPQPQPADPASEEPAIFGQLIAPAAPPSGQPAPPLPGNPVPTVPPPDSAGGDPPPVIGQVPTMPQPPGPAPRLSPPPARPIAPDAAGDPPPPPPLPEDDQFDDMSDEEMLRLLDESLGPAGSPPPAPRAGDTDAPARPTPPPPPPAAADNSLAGNWSGGDDEIRIDATLTADGRFRYTSTYDGETEQAAGRWKLQGDRLLLYWEDDAEPGETYRVRRVDANTIDLTDPDGETLRLKRQGAAAPGAAAPGPATPGGAAPGQPAPPRTPEQAAGIDMVGLWTGRPDNTEWALELIADGKFNLTIGMPAGKAEQAGRWRVEDGKLLLTAEIAEGKDGSTKTLAIRWVDRNTIELTDPAKEDSKVLRLTRKPAGGAAAPVDPLVGRWVTRSMETELHLVIHADNTCRYWVTSPAGRQENSGTWKKAGNRFTITDRDGETIVYGFNISDDGQSLLLHQIETGTQIQFRREPAAGQN